MTYILYTLPNCHKCEDVKKYLKFKRIKYQEVNSGLGNGRKKFQAFYEKNRQNIKRDNHKQIIVPILFNDSKIMQGLEDIVENL